MKTIFWAVDCQKDFMEKDGNLYIKGAEEIVPNLEKLTLVAKELNIQVINTMDSHSKGDGELSDTPDFINTFPEHCMIGTDGISFIDATYPHKFGRENYYILPNVNDGNKFFDTEKINKSRNIIIPKDKFDVFIGNPNTEDFIKHINPDEIFIYGVATNVCVNCAVLGLLQRGFNVTIVEDAIKELPSLPIKEIIDNWIKKGANFITTNELISNLTK